MTETICTEPDVTIDEDNKGYTVAYVFDSLSNKQALDKFQAQLREGYNALEEDEEPEDEPRVIYVFKTFRDRYDLEIFGKAPKYKKAIDVFDSWLRSKYKYCDHDSMTHAEFKMLEEIWEEWCMTLYDEGAIED